MTKEWLKLLSLERERIISSWSERIKLEKDLGSLSQEERLRLCNEFLDAVSAWCAAGAATEANDYAKKLSHLQSHGLQGFRLAQIQHIYYSLYEVVKQVVEKYQANILFEDTFLSRLHDLLMDILFALSDHYDHNVSRKIQQGMVSFDDRMPKKMAIKEGLTNCFSREYFDFFLNYEVMRSKRYERPLSIIIFEIQQERARADAQAQALYDKRMRAAAQMIKKMVRGSDMVFRFGTDALSVILSETDEKAARAIAERMRAAIAAATAGEDESCAMTVRAAVSGLTQKAHSKDDIITNALMALRHAKE